MLVRAFLNVGLFFGPYVENADDGAFRSNVKCFVLSYHETLKLLRPVKTGVSKAHSARCELGGFRDKEGCELIALDLRISYLHDMPN